MTSSTLVACGLHLSLVNPWVLAVEIPRREELAKRVTEGVVIDPS